MAALTRRSISATVFSGVKIELAQTAGWVILRTDRIRRFQGVMHDAPFPLGPGVGDATR